VREKAAPPRTKLHNTALRETPDIHKEKKRSRKMKVKKRLKMRILRTIAGLKT
jgi:hypothetical protein